MDFPRGSTGLSIFRFHSNVGIRLAAKILAPVPALASASNKEILNLACRLWGEHGDR
jgi:hypothetical protein